MEKEYVASSRIYGLTKSLKEMDQNVTIYLPNLPIENGYNYDFIDKVIYYPVKESLFLNFLRQYYKKNKKRKANNHNNSQKEDFIYESRIYSYIYNIYLRHQIYFYRNTNKYYNIKYSKKMTANLNNSTTNTILFTSSGPSIMNYFGYRIKIKNPNIFWVVDYRDLNQNNPYLSDKFNFKGKKMDKLAFKYADLITTVSHSAKEQNIENAKNMGFDISNKSYVLYNGFSKNEINNSENVNISIKYKNILTTQKIIIAFTGTIYPLRRIDLFLEALKEVENILFVYAGDSFNLIDHFTKKIGIDAKVINLKFIPREEAEFLQKNCNILLQLKADVKENGILTGKFYEYLQRNKKILSLGDQDEEYNLICRNLKNVDILPYDKEKIVKYLKNLKKEDLKETYDPNIDRFSWEYLAKEFDDFVSQKLNERKSDI
ncbi:hypothetical protein CN13_06485 [Petrotoga sp. HKA.pet.4.5]|uniref:hypothetical protein n=1 Tax=Petrotoga sp. HKA.pet.4.5 TaxID=1473155 RepID=UPI000EF150ED|nr:hypothetical protein [Petrotoga sp. HKA.pet.4.5]RLL89233.1 hypothetical protein CN13_06485 [Petrotoga sp. HKA.pet.4.5]